jgi:adenine deaminase
LPELAAQDFAVRGQGGHVRINVLTQRGAGALDERVLEVVDHEVYWQNQPDLALASVWHRHGRNHNHAFAWVAETGLKAGALATTYAHDSHNLVVLGRDAADMAVAANRLRELGGGYVAVRGGKLLAEVALPVAGILAEAPVAELAQDFEAFRAAAADLGVQGNAVTLLTSLPLPVVPRFRPTDMGLVDVEKQEFVSAYVFEP